MKDEIISAVTAAVISALGTAVGSAIGGPNDRSKKPHTHPGGKQHKTIDPGHGKKRPNDDKDKKPTKKRPKNKKDQKSVTQIPGSGVLHSSHTHGNKLDKISNKSSAQLRREFGYTASSDQCLYVGHSSCAHEQLFDATMYAIFRILFRMIKSEIRRWDDDILTPLNPSLLAPINIAMAYTLPGDAPYNSLNTSNMTVNLTSGKTWRDGADQFSAFVRATLGSASVTKPIEIQYFTIIMFNDVAGTELISMAHNLWAHQLIVNVNMQSKMKVQNITNADGVDEDNNVINNVGANPLIGYCYYRETSSNTIEYVDRTFPNAATTQATQAVLVADENNGSLLLDSAETSHQDKNLFKPPTDPKVFSCQKKMKIRLEPGEIFTDTINSHKSMKLNQMIAKAYGMFVIAQRQKVPIGHTSLIGLEKELDPRAATNRSKIRLGVQIDNWTTVSVTKGVEKRLAPIIDVN